jgi:hypothetical protein
LSTSAVVKDLKMASVHAVFAIDGREFGRAGQALSLPAVE